MVKNISHEKLAALKKLAQLRSDLELKKFSAFGQHMQMLQTRVANAQSMMAAGYAASDGSDMMAMRLGHEITRSAAAELYRAENEILSMRPKFDLARGKAIREFGRAEVIGRLHREALQNRKIIRAKPAE